MCTLQLTYPKVHMFVIKSTYYYYVIMLFVPESSIFFSVLYDSVCYDRYLEDIAWSWVMSMMTQSAVLK